MKIGVIGLGSIGMRHAKNLVALGHSVYGADIRPDLEVPFEIGVDGGDFKREVDAFVIASPTRLHYQHAVMAGEAGKPAFIEKPLSDKERFSYLLPCMIGYNLRFHGCVLKTIEWINAGRIGKPLWANFTCGQFNDKPAYLRDGVVLNWSHEIDLALHLLGPGHLEASSVRIIDGCDDMADILITHENGCRSTIHLDYITKPEQRHFTIQGETGRITCTLPSRNLFLLTPDKEQADWFHCRGSYDQDYIDEMKAFIDRIEGKETPGCTGAEALRVLEICLEVRRQAGMTG